jgi:hypothetical protein
MMEVLQTAFNSSKVLNLLTATASHFAFRQERLIGYLCIRGIGAEWLNVCIDDGYMYSTECTSSEKQEYGHLLSLHGITVIKASGS